MRVLFVTPQLQGNGGHLVTLRLAREFSARGVDSKVFVTRGDVASSLRDEAQGLVLIHGLRDKRFRHEFPGVARKLFGAARWADIVVSDHPLGEGLVTAYGSARAVGIPLVVLVQTHLDHKLPGMSVWHQRAARWIYPRVEAAVCVSEAVVDGAKEVGVRPGRAVTIPNGIDLVLLDRKAQEAGRPPHGDEPVVLGVGRLAREKGFDLLIQAHARLRSAGVRHRVVILGEGEARASLERLVDDLGVADSVDMPGHVPNPYPALARADAFCLSSRYEGFSLACLEAVALGIPVIATDVGGAHEILAGGAYGDLVVPDSLEAITESLSRHLADPSRLKKKSQRGQKLQGRFSLSNSVEAHLTLYRSIVNTQ